MRGGIRYRASMERGLGTPRPFLTDFGIAKSVATGSRLTRTGQALGTPAYMSPEQARGEAASLTPATDVWSLGCALYEMLAGRPPWESDTTAGVVAMVLLEEPVRLRKRRPDAPADLERILRAALAKDAGARTRDAGELRDDLDRLSRGERVRARRPGGRRRAAVAVAAALATAGGAALLGLRGVSQDKVPAPPPSETATAGADLAQRALRVRFGDPAEAARLLDAALRADPARHEWRVERGLLLWALGRTAEAAEEWTRVPEGAPAATAALLYRGLLRVLGQRGASAMAVPELEAASRGGGREGRVARAALAAGRRAWSAAREFLEGQDGWEASLLRAYVHTHDPSGDRARAVVEYGAALEHGIRFAWVHHNRGILELGLGDVAAAEEDLSSAIGLQADFAEAWNDRGMVRRRLGRLREAEADLTEAHRLDPADPRHLSNRGLVRQDGGDLRAAIEDFTAALAADPRDPAALGNRGNARLILGEPLAALEDYTGAIGADPGRAEAWYGRGVARQETGDPAGAEKDYGEALRLDPGHDPSRTNRATVRIGREDYAGAEADLREVLRRSPDIPEAWGNLGLALQGLERWAEAAAAYRRFLQLAPADRRAERIRTRLAECEEAARAGTGR